MSPTVVIVALIVGILILAYGVLCFASGLAFGRAMERHRASGEVIDFTRRAA